MAYWESAQLWENRHKARGTKNGLNVLQNPRDRSPEAIGDSLSSLWLQPVYGDQVCTPESSKQNEVCVVKTGKPEMRQKLPFPHLKYLAGFHVCELWIAPEGEVSMCAAQEMRPVRDVTQSCPPGSLCPGPSSTHMTLHLTESERPRTTVPLSSPWALYSQLPWWLSPISSTDQGWNLRSLREHHGLTAVLIPSPLLRELEQQLQLMPRCSGKPLGANYLEEKQNLACASG